MNNWKILKENNDYLINSVGQIKNKKNAILKPGKTKNGYYTVSLTSNKKHRTYYVHRLVANNYIKNQNNYKEVNHIDGNKNNNTVDNLEWCSRSRNLSHAYETGLKPRKRGEENPNSKKVKQTNIKTGEIKIWNSLGEIERTIGYSTGQISGVCNKIWKTAHGCKWEYL